MIKVVDQFGNEVSGIYRGKNGSLIVVDPDKLNRYRKQKRQSEYTKIKIESLENELHEMKQILCKLLKSNENSK